MFCFPGMPTANSNLFIVVVYRILLINIFSPFLLINFYLVTQIYTHIHTHKLLLHGGLTIKIFIFINNLFESFTKTEKKTLNKNKIIKEKLLLIIIIIILIILIIICNFYLYFAILTRLEVYGRCRGVV